MVFENQAPTSKGKIMCITMPNRVSRPICLLALLAMSISCSDRELIPMQVELSRSVSKLPFVIALDQGLYEKYGLDLEVRMRPPEFEGGINLPSNHFFATFWRKVRQFFSDEVLWDPEFEVAGANGRIARVTTDVRDKHWVSIAATDCVVRTHIVAREGLKQLEDLKGLRIGVSNTDTNSGFVALLLAERMGWDAIQDISIMSGANNIDALRDGRVDAFVAHERAHAVALQEGYPVLAATSSWGEGMAGNSVNVEPVWLDDPTNREAIRRFLQATIEGIALFHQNRELTFEVLEKWHGIKDPEVAQKIYEAGRQIPRKPYPCYLGIKKAMKRYDSNEMRKYSPEDFYDDSLIRELDETGFIDSFYTTATSSLP